MQVFDYSNSHLAQEYQDVLSRYFYIRDNRNAVLVDVQGNIKFNGEYEFSDIDILRLIKEKGVIFNKIRDMFALSQEVKEDDFDIEKYIEELSKI